MTSESSAGFHPNHHPQHGGLFAPGGATSSSSGGGSGGAAANYNYGGGSMNLGGNEYPSGRMLFGAQNSLDSSLTHVLDSFPGLKHDGGFAVEWSVDEQFKLEEGLAKYASEHNITKYVKIAASLRDKTVRDVALRCRWMMRKRRKQEHPCLGKKIRDLKVLVSDSLSRMFCGQCCHQLIDLILDMLFSLEKMLEPALKTNMSSASSVNVAPYTSTTNQQCGYMISGGLIILLFTLKKPFKLNAGLWGLVSLNGVVFEVKTIFICVSVLSGTARHLLEENSRSFEQISVNLSTQKVIPEPFCSPNTCDLVLLVSGWKSFIGLICCGEVLMMRKLLLQLQQNIDLFFHVRNNIITVLDSMTKMPGIMSQMPPLPVLLNEELTSSIFLPSSQLTLLLIDKSLDADLLLALLLMHRFSRKCKKYSPAG
ncbi:hypothetical protein SASPL_140589 [Salvia splendens]|uniref:Myb-like domain-containing protein n=1 Tax=Salvia splendens TaxID=180675 RepID=A0A8X8WQL9_SALSN|nr:hypothetical protein SASPL_140589 [Salvia splendens]